MIYIGIGVLGFIAMNIFDLVSLKRVPYGIKPLLWTAGCGMLLYAIVMLCFESNNLPLDDWTVWAGWGLLAVSIFMIMLALFINLPFRKTYVEAGVSSKLVKTGLYALVRHPGVYWVATFMFSFVLISRSSMMLVAAPVFVFLNTAFVIIEDTQPEKHSSFFKVNSRAWKWEIVGLIEAPRGQSLCDGTVRNLLDNIRRETKYKVSIGGNRVNGTLFLGSLLNFNNIEL
jgi:protein-S-isoprenylcysteine O-methyltransferase Ste14